ncbi:MAG: hypothetical protein ACR2LN_02185 [Candidatus Levyibacteriota bacterium]
MVSISVFGQIAGFLAFLSYIPYIHAIFAGKTKPHRATYAIWSMVNIVILFSYFASGARATIWIPLAFAIGQMFIFLLSIKYGFGGAGKLDILCLVGAFVGILSWIITKNPVAALYLSIVVKFLGLIPTIKKSYYHPKTENTLSWAIITLGSFLNLFALTSFNPVISVYPIYLFVSEIVVIMLLFFPTLRLKQVKQQLREQRLSSPSFSIPSYITSPKSVVEDLGHFYETKRKGKIRKILWRFKR